MTPWTTPTGCTVRQLLAGRSNAFLLTSGSARVLVDAGRRNRWPDLQDRLAQAGVDRLDALVLTHAHFDHAENARRIREVYGATVIVHQSEAGFVESGDAPLPAGSVLPTRVLTRRLRRLLAPWFRYDGCPVDVAVRDGLDLARWGFRGSVLHTPGHSRGALSVVLDDELALVGDTMVDVALWSVFPPFADDVAQLLDSWRRLLDTGCRVFLPGHGAAIDRSLLERRYGERRMAAGRRRRTSTVGP